MRISIWIPVLLLTIILADSCKKGPNDPFISLRSRKARMEGKWKLNSGKSEFKSHNPGQQPLASNYYFKDNNGTLSHSGATTFSAFRFHLELIMDRNGTFIVTEDFDGNVLKANGTWNFTTGLGKAKNKQEVFFKITEVNSGDCADHIFNFFSTEFVYKIKELRNKKVVLYRQGHSYFSASGKKTEVDAEFEFKP